MKVWQMGATIMTGAVVGIWPILLVPIAWFLVFLAVRGLVRRGRRRPLALDGWVS